MPLILGAQSAVSTGFTVDNSCRLDAATGAWMYRTQETPTGTGTKASFSCWLKRGIYMATGGYLAIQDFAATSSFAIYENAGKISFGALNSSGFVGTIYNDPKERDPGAWMHVFALWDSTLGVAADRMQLWLNGVRQTNFSSSSNPSQDQVLDCLANNVVTRQLLYSYSYGGGSYFDGYMSQMAFCDGQALAATDFGEFDEDSPTIWKPKDISGLTFGDAGWFLDFGDSADMGADVSGNGNDMTTVTNIDATDQATDSPTNNFCLPNILNKYWCTLSDSNFSEGNANVDFDDAGEGFIDSTLGVGASGGKWYWEVEIDAMSGTVASIMGEAGVCGTQCTDSGGTYGPPGKHADGYIYSLTNGTIKNNGGQTTSWGDALVAGDILGIALDLDNSKIYFARNNTWQNSGDPTSGATGTGAAYITSTTPSSFFRKRRCKWLWKF